MKRLAALLVLTAVLVPSASGHLPPRPGQPCPGGTDAVLTSGQWEKIKSPLGSLTAHAVGGLDGKQVLASDGRLVKRSADGGCTWKDAYDAGLAASVESLAFVGSRAFAVLSRPGRAVASGLLVSDDGGAQWRSAASGLPAVGGYRELVGLGDRLYLTVALGDTGFGGELYTSANGGASWSRASTGDPILRVAIDPLDSSTIYVVRSSHAIERSTDAGATFSALPLPKVPDAAFDPNTDDVDSPNRDTAWRDVAVAHSRGREAVLFAASAPSAAASVTRIVASNDSGRSFFDLPTDGLGPIGGLGFGNSPAQLLFAAGSDSTAFRGAGLLAFDLEYQEWRDVDDLELGSLRDPRAVSLSAAARGHDGYDDVELRRDAADKPDLIARYTPPDPPPGDLTLANKGPCGESVVPPGAGEKEKRVAFAPGSLSLELEPGQPVRVPLSASLRPVPSPLDVYFVIDSSESMDPAIDGVKCSAKRIVRQLEARGIDAEFGLGTYNDRYDTRYERRADLAAPGPDFADALEHLFTRRGKEEPIRTALFQSATGAGLEVSDDNGIGGTTVTKVPAGQGATFRDGALHTAIVIGDEPYEDTTPGEPSADKVIDALKAKDIRALGVQVVPPFFQPLNARDDGRLAQRQLLLRRQLETFAGGSGAVAPAGGVDCDGGGSPDVAAGQPLVCPIRQQGIQQSMAETLVALLADLRDVGDVKLVPRETSGLDVSVEGGAADGVDLHRASAIAGTAIVGCTAGQAGQRMPLSFAVQVGTRVVGELAGSARCGRVTKPAGTLPSPKRPGHQRSAAPAPAGPGPVAPKPGFAAVPAPGQAPQPAIAPPPPAPPTPALAPTSPAASSASASAPAAASAPGAASASAPAPGALAAAPEAAPAPRLATAEASDDSYAMVRAHARSRAAVPAPAAITLGLGFTGAFGFLVLQADRRRRSAVRPARQRIR